MDSAFVLAGGEGTRLRPYTAILPKPLIPLGSESIIERVLRGLRTGGVSPVTISLGYLGHLVEAVVGDGSRWGLDVDYTREPEPLGTAGAMSLIPRRIEDDDILLVINGDTLTTLDYRALIEWFRESRADAAMVCVRRDVTIDYGVVDVDKGGRLRAIQEKPTIQHLLSTGINVMRGRTLRSLPAGRIDMPDFLMDVVDSGGTVLCQETDALWMDLGRPSDLAAANDLVERGAL